MTRLGITGGIGCGKTFVCSIIKDTFSLPVYNCDAEAKRLINTDPDIRESLRRIVGPAVYDRNGTLDRDVLASFLFASDRNMALVNSVVHPSVRQDFRHWCSLQESGLVCLESAILCESGFDSEVDQVLLIEAPTETRISRAMQRDKATRQDIISRMERQDGSLAKSRADYIIYNDADTTRESIVNQLKEKILC